MFGKKDNRRDGARRRLLEDIQRAAGYLRVIVDEARRLKIDVPAGIIVCTDNWSQWSRALASRRPLEDDTE
jgi:hypothetical protein